MDLNMIMKMIPLSNSDQKLFERAQAMAANKTPEQIAQIAQNICTERGLDYTEMIQQFNLFYQQFQNNIK